MNRLSDSERDAMTARPRCMSSRQSDGGGSRSMIVERLPAIDLIGASELFISCPMTRISRWKAWRSSSRSGWLRSDSTSSLVRPAALAERAAPDLPPADAAGKRGVDDARRLAVEAVLQAELLGAPAEQALRRLREQPRAGAIDELQLCVLVEREDRDVDLRHHLAQERRRFERVEALVAQRLDQRVDLDHHLAERIAAARAAGADGEVPFAERGEQVRQGLKRQDDALAEREREAQAEGDDDDGQRPLDLRRVVAGPEKDERDQRAGQRRRQRHEQDPPVMAQPGFAWVVMAHSA